MKNQFIKINGLSVAKELANFVNNELLIETSLSPDIFWQGFEKTVNELAPKNKELLDTRETLQKEIDLWHKKNNKQKFDINNYQNFLKKIGYLHEEGPDFNIKTKNLDPEISIVAGPQLVVPIMNARYS
jgi:Malate synthase